MLPKLERAFGLDASTIYERQRALVDAGLLKTRPGRGPGSGVVATPKNLAILLLALLASDKPSIAVERVKDLMVMEPAKTPKSRRCSFTGKEITLVEALAHMLEKFSPAEMPVVTVSGGQLWATLSEGGPYHMGGMKRTQEYLPADPRKFVPRGKIVKSASFELDDLAAVMRQDGET